MDEREHIERLTARVKLLEAFVDAGIHIADSTNKLCAKLLSENKVLRDGFERSARHIHLVQCSPPKCNPHCIEASYDLARARRYNEE